MPLIIVLLLLLPSCLTVESPVFIDRQTLLENEAAGDWPDMEALFLRKGLSQGPEPYPETGNRAGKKRVYTVLNGDLTFNHKTPEGGS